MLAYGLWWSLEIGLPLPAGCSGGEFPETTRKWIVVHGAEQSRSPDGLSWRNGNEALEPVFLVAPAGQSIWLRFPRESDFRIDLRHRCIECHPVDGLALGTLAHLIFNQVMPRVVAQLGQVVLHASSVEWAGRAVAFVGPSGAGKSSLAAAVCESGAALLADDGLVLAEEENRVLAIPAYPGLRLRPGAPFPGASDAPSFRQKFVLNGEMLPFRFQANPLSLQVIFQLSEADQSGVSVALLSARAAFEAIASNCFRLDAGDRGRMVREFGQITSLVDRLPVYRLSYPRSWSCMPAVIDRIKQTLH